MFLAAANNLDIMGGDISNVYLHGQIHEKIWTRAGPEFGLSIAGCILIIVKSLYGLKPVKSGGLNA